MFAISNTQNEGDTDLYLCITEESEDAVALSLPCTLE